VDDHFVVLSDCIEWVRADVPTVTRHMSPTFDLLLDIDTRRVVGARLWIEEIENAKTCL
jgi:hypothetical protein